MGFTDDQGEGTSASAMQMQMDMGGGGGRSGLTFPEDVSPRFQGKLSSFLLNRTDRFSQLFGANSVSGAGVF